MLVTYVGIFLIIQLYVPSLQFYDAQAQLLSRLESLGACIAQWVLLRFWVLGFWGEGGRFWGLGCSLRNSGI